MYSRLNELLNRAAELGFPNAAVTASVYQQLGIPFAAVERLECSSCEVSPEFGGDPPLLRWTDLEIGRVVAMRGSTYVVVEVNELKHIAWFIQEIYLATVN